ncbi:ImuA family protein [Mucilaginibacter segetis]|uniref:Error-prone repair protein ImuA n=1 Tax=Mucilaginibacter segetis TaxID=2793071 RepID=A0A934PUB9_9SPHI|nr:Error-prone repair protein ImuA [Mucilaginibacter segetis]MBK0379726.1 Error-prone repair protein ImuA [Mucilaginibacter segetis]
MVDAKKDLITRLQKNILQWEGYRPSSLATQQSFGLDDIENNFPNKIFPTATVHEMVCENTEQATTCIGFVSALLAVLMQTGGVCLWISLSDNVYPTALKAFGIEPDKIIFVKLSKDKDVLWVMEEALKCVGLVAVIGELSDIDFKQSRRLQLAVEQSRVTGFIMRNKYDKMGSTACAARWQIKPLLSEPIDGLPGLGFPRWQVELLRARNGKPGSWILEWSAGQFRFIKQEILQEQLQNIG